MTTISPEMEKALDHLTQQFRAMRERFDEESQRLESRARLLAIHGPEAYVRVVIREEERP